jgi:S1-C subfamily serine protease
MLNLAPFGTVIKAAAAMEKKENVSERIKKDYFWLQARGRTIEGEEFSAYGTAKEDGGVTLLEVPQNSSAATAGLKTGDLIQSVNSIKVKDTEDLMLNTESAKGKPLAIGIVRNQKSLTIKIDR